MAPIQEQDSPHQNIGLPDSYESYQLAKKKDIQRADDLSEGILGEYTR
jgi:hypothetical protein